MIIGAYVLVLPSGHFYIGQSGNWPKRLMKHRWQLERNIHDNRKLQSHFTEWADVEIFEFPTNTVEDAKAKERELVARDWGHPLLCNTEDPNDVAGYRRGVPMGPEHAARTSAAQLGRKLTDEWKANISAGHKASKAAAAHIAELAIANKGRVHTPEARIKMSLARTGVPQSQDWVINRTESFSQRVEINGVVYRSGNEAGRHLGIPGNTVMRRCRSTDPAFACWKLL